MSDPFQSPPFLVSFSRPLFFCSQDLRHTNEEHLTLRVDLSDLAADLGKVSTESVMLFVFQDTHAAAMVDVAIKQGRIEADPLNYCLAVIDNVTMGLRLPLFFLPFLFCSLVFPMIQRSVGFTTLITPRWKLRFCGSLRGRSDFPSKRSPLW